MEEDENMFYPIDLSIFKDHIKSTFLDIIDRVSESAKLLIFDEASIRLINFFVDIESFRSRKIIMDKMPSSKFSNPDYNTIIYTIHATKENLEEIQNHITFCTKEKLDKKFHVIFIPKINYECQKFINEKYLKAELTIFNLPIDLIPLDKDIISLDCNDSIKDLYVDGNLDVLSKLTRSIIKFETIFGKIKYKYAKGDNARILKKLLDQEEEISPFDTDSEIFATIILDRSVDFITPLCSQGTYESLLDEYFNIDLNVIKVQPEILAYQEKEQIKLELSSKNKFYSNIRDLNFNHLRIYLHNKVKEEVNFRNEHAKNQKINNQNVNELSEFLEKYKKFQSEREILSNHVCLAEHLTKSTKHPIFSEILRMEQYMLYDELPTYIYEFYESEIAKQTDVNTLMRIMCIESLVHNGMKPKLYDQLKRDFISAYGYQEIFLLKNLEKMKILKKQEQKSNYAYIRETLNLIKVDVNINDPDDASYVFGGYCPITIRLIEAMYQKGWNSIKDLIKKLPGEYEYPIPANEKEMMNTKGKKNFILVVYVGGITYNEIAAIRYLNKINKEFKFIILTTHIINAKKFFNGLRQEFKCSLTMKDYFQQLKQLGVEGTK